MPLRLHPALRGPHVNAERRSVATTDRVAVLPGAGGSRSDPYGRTMAA